MSMEMVVVVAVVVGFMSMIEMPVMVSLAFGAAGVSLAVLVAVLGGELGFGAWLVLMFVSSIGIAKQRAEETREREKVFAEARAVAAHQRAEKEAKAKAEADALEAARALETPEETKAREREEFRRAWNSLVRSEGWAEYQREKYLAGY
jgi:hypothetical protein